MNIELRELNKNDLKMVRDWRNSPEVAQYMYTEHEITEEEHLRWFEKTRNDNSRKYWVIKYNEKELGLASLSNINPVFSSCSWAFYLGDTSIRGAGIGSKVEYSVISYVFDELELNKLRCEVLTSNYKVIQMHENFGFRREAYYREHVLKGGKFEDAVGLGLLKKDWNMIKDFMYNKIYGR